MQNNLQDQPNKGFFGDLNLPKSKNNLEQDQPFTKTGISMSEHNLNPNANKTLLQSISGFKSRTQMQNNVIENIKSSYDIKKGLIFEKKLEIIKQTEKNNNTKLFS
jgi:hypothetical protein